jgi:molybdopterin-containing oxidoreductase family membrane subunit
MGWGLVAYIGQLHLGLGQTGMNRPTYWGVYMVNFIFFIGISQAGTLISAIFRVTGAEWRRPVTRIAEAITVFALIVATLQIIVDMGRVDRLWYVFRYGRLQSPILWDVLVLNMYLIGSITYLYMPLIPDLALLRDNLPADAPAWRRQLYTVLALGWRGNREQWLRLEKSIARMAIVIIPIAISVHTITSWLLATTVQPGWHSTIFGPYFVVSAIFSGTGALLIAMTVIRRIMGLEAYLTWRPYRNLALLLLTMCFIWFYFTYADHLGVAAAQQTDEFAVLAAKLWGRYWPGFWVMIVTVALALWLLLAPRWLPERLVPVRTRLTLATATAASLAGLLLLAPLPFLRPVSAGLFDTLEARRLGWALFIGLSLLALLGLTSWLRSRPMVALMAASALVVVAMWLERWNIIVPTLTHPRLVAYGQYWPTMTEVGLSVGSVAIFVFMFLLFFKFFPAVSIWEVAEGRVVEAAHSQVVYPGPEANEDSLRRWPFRRRQLPSFGYRRLGAPSGEGEMKR